MKLQQLNGFAFDTESNALGAIASVDFENQTIVILTDEEDRVKAKLENVRFLEQIGFIGENGIINHDVLATADGTLYEIVLQEDGKSVQLHTLDNKLNRVEAGDVFGKEDLSALEPYVVLVGNINELEPAPLVDFNIKVVRSQLFHEDVTYFYACNNAENEEVDLIKVVFIGHHLLEETTYERFTLTHEQYVEAVEGGTITETTPQNLMNYVTGMAYGKSQPMVARELDEEEDLEDEDFEDEDNDALTDEEIEESLAHCDECGKHEDHCECW